MPMRKSVIAMADDQALDLSMAVDDALRDGEIDRTEAVKIQREARTLVHLVRRAHGAQREATSMLRYGFVNAQVVREFGPDDPDDGAPQLRAA